MQQAVSVQGQVVQSSAAAEGVAASSAQQDMGSPYREVQLLQRTDCWRTM